MDWLPSTATTCPEVSEDDQHERVPSSGRREQASPEEAEEDVIVTLMDGRCVTINVGQKTTVEDLRDRVAEKMLMMPTQLQIIAGTTVPSPWERALKHGQQFTARICYRSLSAYLADFREAMDEEGDATGQENMPSWPVSDKSVRDVFPRVADSPFPLGPLGPLGPGAEQLIHEVIPGPQLHPAPRRNPQPFAPALPRMMPQRHRRAPRMAPSPSVAHSPPPMGPRSSVPEVATWQPDAWATPQQPTMVRFMSMAQLQGMAQTPPPVAPQAPCPHHFPVPSRDVAQWQPDAWATAGAAAGYARPGP